MLIMNKKTNNVFADYSYLTDPSQTIWDIRI